METLSGLLVVGADRASQDFTTPLLYDKYSIQGICVYTLNKMERFF